MYDPSIGRWLEEDPLGFEAGDANLYRYAGNAPINFADPTGLSLSSTTRPQLLWPGMGFDVNAIRKRIAQLEEQLTKMKAQLLIAQFTQNAINVEYKAVTWLYDGLKYRIAQILRGNPNANVLALRKQLTAYLAQRQRIVQESSQLGALIRRLGVEIDLITKELRKLRDLLESLPHFAINFDEIPVPADRFVDTLVIIS